MFQQMPSNAFVEEALVAFQKGEHQKCVRIIDEAETHIRMVIIFLVVQLITITST